MKLVTKADIKQVAKDILFFLNSENLDSYEKLERKVGHKHFLSRDGEWLEIKFQPAALNTKYLTLSSIKEDTGILLEAGMNKQFNYSNMLIKLDELIPGYERFRVSYPSKNFSQSKDFAGLYLPIKHELISLSQL